MEVHLSDAQKIVLNSYLIPFFPRLTHKYATFWCTPDGEQKAYLFNKKEDALAKAKEVKKEGNTIVCWCNVSAALNATADETPIDSEEFGFIQYWE